MSICSLCHVNKNIVYYDYAPRLNTSPAVSIKLCYPCLTLAGFEKTAQTIFPHLRKCSCNEFYLPKTSNQQKCGVCLFNQFYAPKLQEQVVQVQNKWRKLI